jgi:hypothetical protein
VSRRFKLAIVRARNVTNKPVEVISDQACFKMLMTGPESVMRYWSDTTGGWIDFVDSAMFPWVDITVPAADTSRGKQAQLAFAAPSRRQPRLRPPLRLRRRARYHPSGADDRPQPSGGPAGDGRRVRRGVPDCREPSHLRGPGEDKRPHLHVPRGGSHPRFPALFRP